MRKSEMYRDGDTIIRVNIETESAVIPFSEILEATEFVPDEFGEAPWDDCEGFEHEVIERPDNCYEDSRGYTYSDGRRCRILIRLDTDKQDAELFRYYRAKGASRQVAREKVALQRRKTLDQLVEWYSDGWETYGVKCEMRGLEESCWGYYEDDESYKEEIALQMASALESEGYTVTDKPPDSRVNYKANRRENLKYNLNMFNLV